MASSEGGRDAKVVIPAWLGAHYNNQIDREMNNSA